MQNSRSLQLSDKTKPQRRRVHLDNIATKLAPVWRPRQTTPLTPYAVRMQLIAQAEGSSDAERQQYVRRRLTALDRALTDAEAGALEWWLYCEELLDGRAKGQSWGDRTGGRSGQASPVPDAMIEDLRHFAEVKRRIPSQHRATLRGLSAMMRDPYWDFGPRPEQRRRIKAISEAAAWLASF